jgi:nitrite reductase/ring-hydroxylating ferredoxin subunit
MGELMRRYWLPVMLSSELPAPDCPPVRVKVLSEELVAFRDSTGQVGLLAEHCAHRGASLYFGRNEECGLRCVYHGWKYDVHGNCVDMPNEPPESSFKERIHHTAYKTREAGTAIWVYMGPHDPPPPMPELEWTRVPAGHVYVNKRIQENSYLQNVEGELDSSHVSFLHWRFNRKVGALTDYASPAMLADRAPRFTVLNTDYGLLVGARRNVPGDDSQYFWRITQFMMPTFTMIPAPPGRYLDFTAAVPQDDENMIGLTVAWRPDRPLSAEDLAEIESWESVHTEVDKNFRPVRNRDNNYGLDRQLQKTKNYTGIRGIREQDIAVQESMGPIYDRRKEHLGSSDAAIISMRRRMLQAIKNLQEGREPYEVSHPELYRLRSAIAVLPREVPFDEGAKESLEATV